MNSEGCTSSFPVPAKVGTRSWDMNCFGRNGGEITVSGVFCVTGGSGDVWDDGEPKGRSEVGDEDNDDDSDEGSELSEARVEFVGVGGIDVGTMVSDLSRALLNRPLILG